MHVEFRQAVIPDELRALAAFDRKVFPKADLFPLEAWRAFESHWMLVDGRKAGCCAFERDVNFTDDRMPEEENAPMKGSLYIGSTAILPAYQGQGFGTLMKAWQVAYARRNGFRRIVTNTRKSNVRMIALNRKFGFRVVRTTAEYYHEPVEATVVMVLNLTGRNG